MIEDKCLRYYSKMPKKTRSKSSPPMSKDSANVKARARSKKVHLRELKAASVRTVAKEATHLRCGVAAATRIGVAVEHFVSQLAKEAKDLLGARKTVRPDDLRKALEKVSCGIDSEVILASSAGVQHLSKASVLRLVKEAADVRIAAGVGVMFVAAAEARVAQIASAAGAFAKSVKEKTIGQRHVAAAIRAGVGAF